MSPIIVDPAGGVAFVHAFTGVTPPPRSDGIAWTFVRVEESTSQAGPWTQIAEKAIPVDPTPASADPISVTVTTATLPAGWYRFRFVDGAGDLSPYTAAIYSPASVATAGLTLAGLKRRLDRETNLDDDKLTVYLAAALAQAQAPWPDGCGRLLVADPPVASDPPVSRMVSVRRGRALIPDASEITSAVVAAATVTGYTVLRKDGHIIQISGLAADATQAAITGRFGFAVLPANLLDAIYVLAARMFYEEAAQYADQVEILEGTAMQSYYRQLPPRTKMVFHTFRVPSAIAGLA